MAENGLKGGRHCLSRAGSYVPLAVMPGLVPGIHVGPMVPVPESYSRPNHVDGRDKPGHDN